MGAKEFMEPSDLDFCCFLVENSDKSGIDFHICSFFLSKVYHKRKSCQKVWVLAPTTLKSMGAEAPILTGALTVGGGFQKRWKIAYVKKNGPLSWAKWQAPEEVGNIVKISLWSDQTFGFFNNSQVLGESNFFLGRLYMTIALGMWMKAKVLSC